MKVVVLDTNILIDNVHGFARWIDIALNKTQEYQLIIPTIVVAEYFTAQETETPDGYLRSKNYLNLFRIVDFTFEVAEVLGTILRRKTYVASANTADLIIASTVIYLNADLATKNKTDFAKIPSLRFFDSSTISLAEKN